MKLFGLLQQFTAYCACHVILPLLLCVLVVIQKDVSCGVSPGGRGRSPSGPGRQALVLLPLRSRLRWLPGSVYGRQILKPKRAQGDGGGSNCGPSKVYFDHQKNRFACLERNIIESDMSPLLSNCRQITKEGGTQHERCNMDYVCSLRARIYAKRVILFGLIFPPKTDLPTRFPDLESKDIFKQIKTTCATDRSCLSDECLFTLLKIPKDGLKTTEPAGKSCDGALDWFKKQADKWSIST